jgi:hypothetical protein
MLHALILMLMYLVRLLLLLLPHAAAAVWLEAVQSKLPLGLIALLRYL